MGKTVFFLRRGHGISDVTLKEIDNIVPKLRTVYINDWIYTALQTFGITLVSWLTRGNTATQMTICSRISHRIFSNFA